MSAAESAVETKPGLNRCLVGVPRFERGTSCTPYKCATRLRYTPMTVPLRARTNLRIGRRGVKAPGPIQHRNPLAREG